jgi:hypothetical protein
MEKMLMAAAVRDPRVAGAFDRVGTRRVKPVGELARVMPRIVATNARRAVAA